MPLARTIALQVPALRRLKQANTELRAQNDHLATRLAALQGTPASPFFHYNAAFDAQALMHRHAASGLQPRDGLLTNYLGVLIDPKYLPAILQGRAGTVEGIPIPANWHADIAEWAAALRAVELAQGSFTMIELGCGWGCWMNNTGVAARRLGLEVFLIGIEGDPGHICFAKDALMQNGFSRSQYALHHGIAAAAGGTALFPRQDQAGIAWGLAPVFGASEAERDRAINAGSHDVLTMIPLADLATARSHIDLLHIDIQGGEADLVAGSLSFINQKVGYLVIGTHSRQIEGRLFETLTKAGWHLEIERPALLALHPSGPSVTVDGVQGWRNMKLAA